MLIGAIIVFCVLLFLARCCSRGCRASSSGVATRRWAWASGPPGKAPGRLGRWLQKPFGKSRKAVHKSGSAGRRTRFKLPF